MVFIKLNIDALISNFRVVLNFRVILSYIRVIVIVISIFVVNIIFVVFLLEKVDMSRLWDILISLNKKVLSWWNGNSRTSQCSWFSFVFVFLNTVVTKFNIKKVLCCIVGDLHSLNYSRYIGITVYFDIFSDVSRYFGEDHFSRGSGEGEGGSYDAPYKSRAKPLLGTKGESSWKLQGFSTPELLTFD